MLGVCFPVLYCITHITHIHLGLRFKPTLLQFRVLGSGKLNQHKQRGVGQQNEKYWLFSASTVKFPSREIKAARYSSGDLGKIIQQPAQAVFCLQNLISTPVMCSGARCPWVEVSLNSAVYGKFFFPQTNSGSPIMGQLNASDWLLEGRVNFSIFWVLNLLLAWGRVNSLGNVPVGSSRDGTAPRAALLLSPHGRRSGSPSPKSG